MSALNEADALAVGVRWKTVLKEEFANANQG